MDVSKIIHDFRPRLLTFVRQRVSSNAESEDIVQDVFFQLIKTADSAANPIQQVSGWLYKVARNTIINQKKKKREQEYPVYKNHKADDGSLKELADFLFNNSSSPSPDDENLRALVWTELEAALAELPYEQREIFELSEMNGIPVKDIAELVGIPVNTVLSRKHYAIKHLRNRLSDIYNELLYS